MAVEDCRAAATDAATQEPSKKQEANEANGEPSPPDGAALSVHAKSGTLAGVTLGDGGETLVQVRNQALLRTLSTVDLCKEVVDVVLSLAECFVGIVTCISAEARPRLDGDCEGGEEEEDGHQLLRSHSLSTFLWL